MSERNKWDSKTTTAGRALEAMKHGVDLPRVPQPTAPSEAVEEWLELDLQASKAKERGGFVALSHDLADRILARLATPAEPTSRLLDGDRMEAWLRGYHPAAVAARNDGTEWTEEDEDALRTLLRNMSVAPAEPREPGAWIAARDWSHITRGPSPFPWYKLATLYRKRPDPFVGELLYVTVGAHPGGEKEPTDDR